MKFESRTICSNKAAEFYLTATPDLALEPADEAERMFAAVAAEAERRGGRICHLRAFVPQGQLAAYQQAWLSACGTGQAFCRCTWLEAGPAAPGGLQAHVIVAPVNWSPLRDASGIQAGWLASNHETRWALVSGLCLPRTSDDVASTVNAFQTAESLLAPAGMGLGDIARTWFFLEDILAWYDRFNAGRNDIFRRRGLLSPAADGVNVPASTGIGVAPAGGGRLALDIFAVRGQAGCVKRYPAAGKQRSAYEYGSAFARSAEAVTPGGRTVFVSGTAAIDAAGKTCFLDDADGQIRMTLDNVLAVLSNMGCGPDSVVQAMAYCKTPAVAESFAAKFQHTLAWPWVTVVGDVCRDDLLFEVEVTAKG